MIKSQQQQLLPVSVPSPLQQSPQQLSSSDAANIITRKRSSSKTRSNYNPTSSHEQQQLSLRSGEFNNNGNAYQRQVAPIDRLVWVLKLKSLNNTFEQKSLVVPLAPETLKLGRPGGSKIQSKSTNGFFDSRVLSRNHAELFINSGSLLIRDLKSSNGTYINGKQIEPFKACELKIGDKFDLGSNLENQTAHKKISCEVVDLLLMGFQSYNDSIYKLDQERQIHEKEFFNNVADLLIYGDVVNDMYEDNLLNLLAMGKSDNKKLENNFSISGLYPSSNIKNSSKLEDTISQLLMILNNEFLQNEKLQRLQKFLINYNENLDKFEEYIQKKHSKLNTSLQKLVDEYKEKIDESDGRITGLEAKITELTDELKDTRQKYDSSQELVQDLQLQISAKDSELKRVKLQYQDLEFKYDEIVREREMFLESQVDEEKLNAKDKSIQDNEFNDDEQSEQSEEIEITDDSIIDNDLKLNSKIRQGKNQNLKPNLFQATIVLLASVIVGVSYYQKN